MIVWIVLVGWILLIRLISGSLETKREKLFFLFMSGIALVFVIGSRYIDLEGIGDLNFYARLYFQMPDVPWNDLIGFLDMDPGYLVLNKLCSMAFPHPQTIVFVEAIICVFFSFRFIYKFCNDVFLGVLCYMAQGLMIFEMTGFRQGIAISLCLFAVEFIERRKIVPFLLIVLLAVSFHSTAIVFFPLYFIANLKPSIKIAGLYTICYYALIRVLPDLLLFGSDLTGNDYSEAVTKGTLTGPIINVIFYITTIIILLMLRDNSEHNIKNVRYLKWNMCILGLIIYMLRFISLPFERVSFYFSGGVIAALPDAVLDAFDEYHRKIIHTLMVVMFIFLFFVRVYGNAIGDYRFFWS